MRVVRNTLQLSLVVLAMFAFAACETGDPSTSPSGDEAFAYGAYNLEDENGGFDESSGTEPFEEVDGEDELPHFEAADEEDVTEDPTVNPDGEEPTAPEIEAVYMVRILWGQPFPNPLTPSVTDWSGEIRAVGAGLRVRRLIRFERATGDHVERIDRSAITVVSTTKPHNDGLLLQVIQPKLDDPSVTVMPALHIDLGGVSLTYDLAQLAGTSDLQLADDLGNVVFVQAYQMHGEPCARGLVDGFWKRLDRRGGVFGGRWLTADGDAGGRIAGIWGRRMNGHRVLFGVYRKPDGTFGGILRGTYTPFGMRPHPEPMGDSGAVDADGDGTTDTAADDAAPTIDGEELVDEPERRADGGFAMRWLSRDRRHHGVVRGLYAGNGEGEGRFRGRWLAACRERPADAGVPDTAPECDATAADCAPELPDTTGDGPRPSAAGDAQ